MSNILLDWTQLPFDLLQKITNHLTEISDRLRFCAVCVQWRSSASSFISNHPQQLPWLYVSKKDENPYNNLNNDGKFRFLSISENKIYTFSFPEFRNHKIFSSPQPHGWLMALCEEFDESNVKYYVSLVNPITRNSISLPLLSFPKLLPTIPAHSHTAKAMLLGSSNLIIVIIPEDYSHIFIFRLGETKWNKVNNDQISFSRPGTCIVHDGRFFVFDRYTCDTVVVDMQNLGKALYVIPRPTNDWWRFYLHNLVESPSGELLLVPSQKALREYRNLNLYRLDASGEQPKWVGISSIGDNTIFMTWFQLMCFPSSNFKGCRENCIYYMDEVNFVKCHTTFQFDEVRLFDIGECKTDERKPLLCSGRDGLHFGLAPFTPSLC